MSKNQRIAVANKLVPLFKELGKVPNIQEYKDVWTPDLPKPNVLKRVFGSWGRIEGILDRYNHEALIEIYHGEEAQAKIEELRAAAKAAGEAKQDVFDKLEAAKIALNEEKAKQIEKAKKAYDKETARLAKAKDVLRGLVEAEEDTEAAIEDLNDATLAEKKAKTSLESLRDKAKGFVNGK